MYCTVLRTNSDCFPIKHGRSTFFGKGPQSLLPTGSRAASGKKSVTGIPNRLNGRGIYTRIRSLENLQKTTFSRKSLFSFFFKRRGRGEAEEEGE